MVALDGTRRSCLEVEQVRAREGPQALDRERDLVAEVVAVAGGERVLPATSRSLMGDAEFVNTAPTARVP